MSNLNLGQIITTPQHRDAIHIAVAPVIAGESLAAGERVGLEDGKASVYAEQIIGIVDPFLETAVRKGQTFWLFLFPNTITALRHEWTHPAFESTSPVSDAKPVAKAVLESYAQRIGCSLKQLIAALDIYADGLCLDDNDIQQGLNSIGDEDEITVMWEAYSKFRGRSVSKDISATPYFRCAC